MSQRANVSEAKANEMKDDLSKVANNLPDLEWSLNGQALQADQAVKEETGMGDQEKKIDAQIKEIGEEAEARVTEAEREMHTKVEEVTELQ